VQLEGLHGAGITGFGLIGARASDSVYAATFLQLTVSYIPTPGPSPTLTRT
jgi:hypothetical protein